MDAIEQLRMAERLNPRSNEGERPSYNSAIRVAILELDDRLKALEAKEGE